MNVTTDANGKVTGFAADAWYTEAASGMAGRGIGFFVYDSSKTITPGMNGGTACLAGGKWVNVRPADYEPVLAAGYNKLYGEMSGNEEWIHLELDADTCAKMDSNKEYYIYAYTTYTDAQGPGLSFESCMGKIAKVTVNRYINSVAKPDEYKKVQTISSMNIIGTTLNDVIVSYPHAVINSSKTGTIANTTTQGQTYNIYYDLETELVKFDANGGVGSSPDQNILYGGKAVKPTETFTKTDYNFIGWSKDPNSKRANFSFSTAIKEPTTLYAVWRSPNDPDPGPADEPGGDYLEPLKTDLEEKIATSASGDVIVWEIGECLPDYIMQLIKQSDVTVEFKYTYEGVDYDIFLDKHCIPDERVEVCGPLYLAHLANLYGKKRVLGDYVVVEGDTLNKISARFGVSVESILAKNKFIKDKHWIYPGQVLDL